MSLDKGLYSQSAALLTMPEDAGPGLKESTLEAGIVMESFGGAPGADKSLAFFSVRPEVRN